MEIVVYITVILCIYPSTVQGGAEIIVKPYPALIYHGAVPGTAVLSVTAYETDTNQPLSNVALTNSRDSKYFTLVQEKIPSEWKLQVNRTIDKPVDYQFSFSVYGYYQNAPQDRRIHIKVTEENKHAPSFEQKEYEFLALRNGMDFNLTDIGFVKAVDLDPEPYNKLFHYHILDPENNFDVDLETGLIEMIQNVPESVDNVTFRVTAIDGGSPQRLNTTTVVVKITDLPPPDVFCVAVMEDVARICWKDPTNGSYVMKYELLFQMDENNATTVPVEVDGVKDETCSIVRGNQLGKNYTFTVRVLNGLEWSPESLQQTVRIQKKGLYGDCPKFSNCSIWEPCENGGECIVNPDLSYSCNCTPGWGGVNCTGRDLCSETTCLNGGLCTYTGDLNFTCDCPLTHYGDRCEKLSPCVHSPCGEGHCFQRGEGHVCECPDKTSRTNCDDAYCEEDRTFYDETGWYVWPRTKSGDTAQVYCKHGTLSTFTIGFAERSCGVNFDGTTYWEPADTSECKPLQETDISKNLRSLASLTKDASGLQSEEIANITTMLEEYFFFSFGNKEIATEMTMVVGNLLDANETVIIESNSRNHSSDRLLWLLDEYSSKVEVTEDVVIETENINIHVANHTTPDVNFTYQPYLTENNQTTRGGVNLKLPVEAFQTSDEEQPPRIQLMTFRSSSFFIPEEAPPPEVVIKQWVVSVVVQDKTVTNLSTPVEIIIQNIKDGDNHSCAYWDVENRTWSDEGLMTVERGPNYTKCYSYHLTSFAILLDPSPEHRLDPGHERILTYISYIGCGISMIGLILTLLTYSLFRHRSTSSSRVLNREKSGKILMNLCSSMLLLNIVFFLGSEASLSLSGEVMCKVVAILLHYFLLTTLTWMLVEAINMYQALITVFTKYSGFFMLKRCIFAWGTPAVIVIATAAINIDNYKTSTELCFLSQGNPLAFYLALLGPACFILLINFAVFIMVSRVILRPKFKGQVGKNTSDSLNPAQIRGAFTVMTLLGVTWVFGPLAINEAKLVINYVFTVLNSLQGFLIFVFRCCFNPEVRMAWLMLIKTGKFKRRKGQVTAFTSDSTSSKSESKLNGSFADTMKSNMYNSLGKQRNVLNNDKNLDTKNKNINSKAAKDLHGYFDGVQRHRGSESRNGHPDNYRNGHREDVHRKNDHNGVTTIYTGKYNGVRKLSGCVSDRDEFTRL